MFEGDGNENFSHQPAANLDACQFGNKADSDTIKTASSGADGSSRSTDEHELINEPPVQYSNRNLAQSQEPGKQTIKTDETEGSVYAEPKNASQIPLQRKSSLKQKQSHSLDSNDHALKNFANIFIRCSDKSSSLRVAEDLFKRCSINSFEEPTPTPCDNNNNCRSIDKASDSLNSGYVCSLPSNEYSNYSSGGYRVLRSSTTSDRGSDRDMMDPLESYHHHSYHDEPEHHHHHHHHHHRREGTVKRGQFTRSLSNTEPPTEDKAGEKTFNLIILLLWLIAKIRL